MFSESVLVYPAIGRLGGRTGNRRMWGVKIGGVFTYQASPRTRLRSNERAEGKDKSLKERGTTIKQTITLITQNNKKNEYPLYSL